MVDWQDFVSLSERTGSDGKSLNWDTDKNAHLIEHKRVRTDIFCYCCLCLSVLVMTTPGDKNLIRDCTSPPFSSK